MFSFTICLRHFLGAGACLSRSFPQSGRSLFSQAASFLSWFQFCTWYMDNWHRHYI